MQNYIEVCTEKSVYSNLIHCLTYFCITKYVRTSNQTFPTLKTIVIIPFRTDALSKRVRIMRTSLSVLDYP